MVAKHAQGHRFERLVCRAEGVVDHCKVLHGRRGAINAESSLGNQSEGNKDNNYMGKNDQLTKEHKYMVIPFNPPIGVY